MKKIYTLGLSLGATLSIVAPISTIACGNSHDKAMPHQGKNDNKKIKWTNLDYTTNTNKPVSTIPKPAPLVSKPWTNVDSATNVAFDIMKTPSYTYDSLKAEAIKIGNNARWRHGLSYEATLNGVALVRALAEINGYDENAYYDKIGVTSIDENNKVTERKFNSLESTSFLADTSASDFEANRNSVVENLKKLSAKNAIPTDVQSKNINQLFGTLDGTSPTTLLSDRSWIDVSNASAADLNAPSAKPYQQKVYSYADYKNPGNIIVKVYNPIYRVVKTMTLKGLGEKYPIIKEEDKLPIKPYIDATIKKFIEVFIPNSGTISALHPGIDEQMNMLNYVADKFSYKDKNNNDSPVASITNQTLEDLWDKVNNGSINLQAVKLLGVGIDLESFKNIQGVDANVFVNDKNPVSNGVRDAGVMDLLNWFNEAKGKTPVFTEDYASWK